MMQFIVIDECGPIPETIVGILRGVSEGGIITADNIQDEGIIHTEGAQYITYDYLAMAELEVPYIHEKEICLYCGRNHTRNFCTRKGRSKHFKM